MSLASHSVHPIPEETRRVAQAAFPRPSRFMQMRDRLGTIYDDAAFGALYPPRGQPAEAPWRLALVTVMQFADALTDRQAADAVRSRIDWKYALGLELTDAGFHYSVLSKFRARLVAGGAEQLLLDVLLTRFHACGLLKAGGQARTDSTHVVAAIRALNRLECVGEMLRAALNDLAIVAPDWLRQQVTADWFERYGTRIEESRLPKGEAQRYAYAEQIGADGFQLLSALYHDTAPHWLREIPSVDILHQTWVHQYYTDEHGYLRWRQAHDLPPAGMRMDSPYDPDAHFGNKRSITWTGYKVHVTETWVVYLERTDKCDGLVRSRQRVGNKAVIFPLIGSTGRCEALFTSLRAHLAPHPTITRCPCYLQPCGLWPRRHAKQQHLPQRPDMIREISRHGRRLGLPALG
jgi:transposase